MYNSEKQRTFKNRKDAGQQLGIFLKPKYKKIDPLIVGIPRGGIEVAYYAAGILEAELAVIVSKKLPFPGNDEVGFGAVTEENEVYVSTIGKETLSEEVILRIINVQLKEVKRRVETYRSGIPLPNMCGRSIILVDDGIATGATLVPVIRLCRKKKASRIIIAAPVSGTTYDIQLNRADAIEILVQPDDFYGVGQAYDRFGDFTDEEVLALLKPVIK